MHFHSSLQYIQFISQIIPVSLIQFLSASYICFSSFYIYSFSRFFYPKQLTNEFCFCECVHTFCVCLLQQCSNVIQRYYVVLLLDPRSTSVIIHDGEVRQRQTVLIKLLVICRSRQPCWQHFAVPLQMGLSPGLWTFLIPPCKIICHLFKK